MKYYIFHKAYVVQKYLGYATIQIAYSERELSKFLRPDIFFSYIRIYLYRINQFF